MKEHFSNFFKKYNHALILLILAAVLKWFWYLEGIIEPRYWISTRLDSYIPFVKEFVVPYLIWFIYIAVVMVFLFFKSKPDFIKICGFMFSGMAICLIIYSLLPNGQKLRPEIAGSDIFSNLIRILYKNDTPTNSCPSMHVVQAISVHAALVHYKGLDGNKLIRPASFVLMLLIIMSTVFIKQHSIIDVVYGIILSMILYVLVHKIDYRSLFNRLHADQAGRKSPYGGTHV